MRIINRIKYVIAIISSDKSDKIILYYIDIGNTVNG